MKYKLPDGTKIYIPDNFEMLDITKFKPHPKNVKKHPKNQIKGIAEAIKLVGFVQSIVIDKKNGIKAGHGKFEAAKYLGMTEAPFVRLETLSKEVLDAYMILDNRLADISPYDKDNMTSILSEIPTFDFEPFHVDLDEFKPPPEITEDEAPDLREQTDVKPGDIYQLGDHFVMCGDSQNEDFVKELLKDKEVDSLVTDPPYGVDYSKKNEFLNLFDAGCRIQKPIKNDDIKNYREFTKSWLSITPMAKYNSVYIFQSALYLHECRIAFEDLGFTWGADLIWKKNNMVFGRKDYKFKHEPVIYGWKKTHKFYGPNNRNTILEYDRPHVSDLHPTMKPIALMAQLLTDGTKEGMIVYDPFGGSGSTLIACEQTGRICYTMEIDIFYVQVIIDRWEKLTNRKAVKL